MGDWHSRPAGQVMKELDSGPQGLTHREAAHRLEKTGPNQLAQPAPPSLLVRILSQLKDPMILVLLTAAALSLAALVCLVIAFWDKLTACMICRQESDDYDDAALYE